MGGEVLKGGLAQRKLSAREGRDSRTATAGSLKLPWTHDPSKTTVKSHTHPRHTGIPERDPQTHTNDMHDTDLSHYPEAGTLAHTHNSIRFLTAGLP